MNQNEHSSKTVDPPSPVQPADAHKPETDAQPSADKSVQRGTLGLLLLIGLSLTWDLFADRYSPYSSQARVQAFVVPVAPDRHPGRGRRKTILRRVDPRHRFRPYDDPATICRASLVTVLIVLAYVALAFISASIPGHILLSNSFFLVSAHILGMFSSYGIEFYARTAFWQRRLVIEHQKALEQEHERKTRELAAARDVQISMLPRSMPDHPLLELSVAMRTATEIGGDYYDVIVAPDGTLTFALADAAGHGARTGAMVAAMKVMFSNHAADDDIERFVERASLHN